jgi:tetratricopeptide (TPR) repeat protein
MKTTRSKAAAPRLPRRWRTPPPLTRGSESLEGMEILREVGGEVGILLWQAYRNVMFWASADQEDRAQLFSPEAGKKRAAELAEARIPDELAGPLSTFTEMLSAADRIQGDAVAQACTGVARWADYEGHLNTALSFTQAAAVASQRNARLALAVGQLARRHGELPRAETWFRHTVMVSRQTGEWESYARAYIALGNMLIQRGNYPAAHRMHIKALRAARRKGLQLIQGMALHDLFVIATEAGRVSQAEEYARQAYRAYGPNHPSVPALAHDVAYFWMNQGHFGRALPIFEGVLPHFNDPAVRFVVQAHIARAAGGSGDRVAFRRYWTECMRIAKEPFARAVAADALTELALGASSLNEWDRAEQAATKAIEIAQETGDSKALMRSEAILDGVRNGRQVEERSGQRAQISSSKTAEQLAAQFIDALAPA